MEIPVFFIETYEGPAPVVLNIELKSQSSIGLHG